MVQSIARLPEFADISLGHHTIQIRNHRMEYLGSL